MAFAAAILDILVDDNFRTRDGMDKIMSVVIFKKIPHYYGCVYYYEVKNSYFYLKKRSLLIRNGGSILLLRAYLRSGVAGPPLEPNKQQAKQSSVRLREAHWFPQSPTIVRITERSSKRKKPGCYSNRSQH